MEDAIALAALRRLSIDIANLTSQLALLQATSEYIRQVADGIRPDEWIQVDEVDDPRFVLRGDQMDALSALLAALNLLG